MRRKGSVAAVVTAAVGLILTSTVSVAAATTNAHTAGPATTTHNVQPQYNSGNITACPRSTTTFVNTSNSKSGTQPGSPADNNGGRHYANKGTTFDTTVDPSDTYISFTTNSPSFTVYVKGGGAYDAYNYTGTQSHPAFPSDTGLHAPLDSGANIPTVNHYVVCGQPASAAPQGSCEGSGSLSALVNVNGTDVTSYVPKGNWSSGTPGIDVVNVEGTSITNTTVPTGSDIINSCASNSITGQTVCTANNNDVYVLKGTGLDPSVANPLSDSGTGTIRFSGGSATTSGVSMNAIDNKALIALSIGGIGGFQFLDLATNTFEPAFTTKDSTGAISEDPLVDPIRHLVLSASENNNYEIANVSNSTSPQFFEHPVTGVSGVLDASAEDCSTGIILAPTEFSSPSQVEIADIGNAGTAPEAVFTPGTPGSWTAPEQVQTLTGSVLSAGANGTAVAQGTHTGVISGEFGGDGLTALALPTTSGAGAVPAISDWVTCHIGADPSGHTFAMGFDPHTLAAYRSPNGGHPIALLVNDDASEMVRVDLADMLNPTAVPATGHICDGTTLPVSARTFIPLP